MASNNMFFLSIINDVTTRNVKISNITKLAGQVNYNTWVSTMIIVWRALNVYELVVEGRKPQINDSAEEIKAFESLKNHALTVYLEVVSQDLLDRIIQLEDPHQMWTYLKQQYRRDTSFALVSQMRMLINLVNAYDASSSISDYILAFESEWMNLHRMAKASTDPYRVFLSKFLEEDKAKRDFLLALLAEHHENIVDNITTKDEFSFTEVKQRLMNIDHQKSQTSQVALITKEDNRNFKISKHQSQYNPNQCNWCKKHHPGRHLGHSWNNCKRLKEFKKKID
ncbi:hypothetical protein K3495_g16232, partial [Podosphaera aphanis]